ncbi:MAG: hypothetical protein QOE19_1505 [Actinomycetota bacterium]|nr:hypothetical protein [Actinomycetota bacterium]MDQ1669107.1 hypothetical protein [Actinomycetota bacterium]
MPQSPLPRSPLALVAGLVGLQGVVLVVIAVAFVVELAVATAADVTRALVTALLALVSGVALLLVARGLRQGRRWARAPALVTNLILVPVAIGLFQGGRWQVGAPLLAAAAAVVVLLFSRPVNAVLDETDPDQQR